MRIRKVAIIALAAFSLSALAYAEGSGESGKALVIAPPQPRIVEQYRKPGLPPREADPSWGLYQEGLRLYGEKRLGESIDSLKKAIDARSELFERCAQDLNAAADAKEAKKSKDSLAALVRLLAARDLIPQDCEAIRSMAGGSIVTEMQLLRATSPSAPLRGLIDTALLVVEERGISRVGDSLQALKREVAYLSSYPEAEHWIGKAFFAEGELRLAELQFRRSCDMWESLEVSEDRYGMLEDLAEVYKAKGDLKDYEVTLREIADASDLFSTKDEYYRGSMERTLGERGFDRFMMLFKVDQSFPIGAYSALGELYLGAGRTISNIYLAAATNAILTRSISDIRIDEPSYEYAGLKDLLSRILADKEEARFAADMELWKGLSLLGESLAASGYRESAREIWTALVSSGAPQPWKKRSAEDLARPASALRKL
jgi:tetratricopeptide (TPR) repeat protein